jgi:hypothetical protein
LHGQRGMEEEAKSGVLVIKQRVLRTLYDKPSGNILANKHTLLLAPFDSYKEKLHFILEHFSPHWQYANDVRRPINF